MTQKFCTDSRHPLSKLALDDTQAANAYESMAHDPNSYTIRRAYLDFEFETLAQFRDIVASGFLYVWDDGRHEYANSAAMHADADQGFIYVRHTELSGDLAAMPEDHPLRRVVMTHYGAGELTLNDVFRAVHDINGHHGPIGAERYSFGPNGERNAWMRHRQWYSDSALPALWCETRGQSSWVNDYADHRSIPCAERPFAVQKVGLVNPLFY